MPQKIKILKTLKFKASMIPKCHEALEVQTKSNG
jgi:hypothetical protein